MFLTLLSNWRIILGGVALAAFLALGFVAWHRGNEIDALNGKVGQLAQEVQTATDIAKKNDDAAKAIQAKAESDFKVLEQERADALKRVAAARQREREILNVDPSKDGAVAPVLRNTLMRFKSAPASGSN